MWKPRHIIPFIGLLCIICSLESNAQKTGAFIDSAGSTIALDSFVSKNKSFPLNRIRDSLSFKSLSPQPKLEIRVDKIGVQKPKQLIQSSGGVVSYNFLYQSLLDTPFAAKDLAQHQLQAGFNFTVADFLPLRVNAFLRRSNSNLFRDITDVQVQFDGARFRSLLQSRLQNELLKKGAGIKDTLAQKLIALKERQIASLKGELKNPFTEQKLLQANEILRVPKITYKMELPDSVNKWKEDSLRLVASSFIDQYTKKRALYDSISRDLDSLKQAYQNSLKRYSEFEKLVKGKSFGNYTAYKTWKHNLDQYVPGVELPARYLWLMGVRQFALGKSAVNTSELTVKNVSVTGINFEYNSWYYVGVLAGTVEYRFHDFLSNRFSRIPQYIYQLRLGVGRLESDYLILSAFKGQKQLFATTTSSNQSTGIKTSGMSAQAKWQVAQHTFLTGEIAQSFSPDFRKYPLEASKEWNLSDKTNKAYFVRLSSSFPKTRSRLEGYYKYTGANYQAFNSFQTNSQQNAWMVRGEQNFFARRLKLTGAVQTNDFSNPYLVQNYKTNTVFKSLSASFTMKRFPVITMGYMPMSQLVKMDTTLAESRFQTLSGSISHFYKIGESRASSSLIYTRFFNSANDTGFIYYNSINYYIGQNLFFKGFTLNASASYSRSNDYNYTVLEEGIQLPVRKRLTVSGALRVNRLSQEMIKLGAGLGGEIRLFKADLISFRADKSYIPGSGHQLLPYTSGSINFTKTIN